MSTTTLTQREETEANRQFVNRSEFCRLALSTRKLLRSDQRRHGIRGLLDPRSGQLYVIREKDLLGPPVVDDLRRA